MKNFTTVLLMLYVSVLFSQTISQKLEWGQIVDLTLPSTPFQTYSTINLHSESVVIVPENVSLTITGQVQGGKIIFLGNNVVTIKGDVNGNGKMEIGKKSSLEIVGSINSNPELIFSGNNTLVAKNIFGDATVIRLHGNTCLRILYQLNNNTKFIGTGENNNVNYNVPANWGYQFSAPNISFSNNTNVTCNLPVACTPPANNNAYGTNEWNGYVYTYSDKVPNFSTATYVGTLKEDALFDRDMGHGTVNGRAGTLAIPCVAPPSDTFMVRYLQKVNLSAGTYNFTVGGDDGYRLSLDGGKTWWIDSWKDQAYSATSKQLTLPASGAREMVLEYYERTGGARISFSYGKVEGNAAEYGKNIWNVYGYNYFDNSKNQIVVPEEFYSGYYTQETLGVDTRDIKNNGWHQEQSPSLSADWRGAPIPKDKFTISHKRQGFPCGHYEIVMSNWDDMAELYLDGIKIWSSYNVNSGSELLKSRYTLKENSKMELRLKENDGGAGIKMELKNVPYVLNGAASVSMEKANGAHLRVEKNTILSQDLEVCSCTIVSGSSFTVGTNTTLTVQTDVVVEEKGTMIIENNGSLVQINNNAKNSGSIMVRRHSAPVIQTDYTYWSSPVDSKFTLHELSPTTPASKFYQWDPVKEWQLLRGGKYDMEAGRGYIVRAPQEFSKTDRKIFEAAFVGTPNNGRISQPITSNMNLIGNPYPSAISADEIYKANHNVILGTFLFWTHNTPISNKTEGQYALNYSPDDYASYNIVGGVKTESAKSGGQAPTGEIASGQGFFVTGKATGGKLTFDNAMRLKGNNQQFFRSSADADPEEAPTSFERHRFWLNISNEAGSFNETLIGYISTATNGLDDAFDGATSSGGNALIYSLVENENLVIQGRALPFTNLDVVPLGIKISASGQFTINMDQFDGLFINQDIYLFDHFNGTLHDLKSADYVFASDRGTFDTRFEVRYVDQSVLKTDTSVISSNDVLIYTMENQVVIKSQIDILDQIEIYDITGRRIFSKSNIINNEYKSPGLHLGAQVVIVKVRFANNQMVIKKVMLP